MNSPAIFQTHMDLDRCVESADPGQRARLPSVWVPRADMIQTNDTVLVRVDLPGLTAKDFEVEVDGRDLVIRGERKSTPAGSSITHRERFYRRVTFPVPIEAEEIEADFNDGVLTVTAPVPADVCGRL